MKPNPLAALYHFTVPISWTLVSKGCRFNGALKFFRGDLGGAAVLLSMPMTSVTWSPLCAGAVRNSSVTPGWRAPMLMPASAEAWRKASPDPSESSTKPYRFPGLNHFSLPQTVGAGGSPSCVSASCGGDLGMAQRVAVVRLSLRHDFAMARSAITVCFSDDLPSTLTNQSASLYDEIRYGFEHARLRKIDSRYSVSAGQLPRRGEKLPEATAKKQGTLERRCQGAAGGALCHGFRGCGNINWPGIGSDRAPRQATHFVSNSNVFSHIRGGVSRLGSETQSDRLSLQ